MGQGSRHARGASGWDGTGDYPSTEIEVFAIDRPADYDGGMLGVGFAIAGSAGSDPARNPFLNLTYQGMKLSPGYIIGSQGVELGLTGLNRAGFATIALARVDAQHDWQQPMATLRLPDGFHIDLPLLMDTGIEEMLLWLDKAKRPTALASAATFPAGVAVTISAPASSSVPALQYSFVTGDASNPMAPSSVKWRNGDGINTGIKVLAGADYLYDAAAGSIGFRTRSAVEQPLDKQM